MRLDHLLSKENRLRGKTLEDRGVKFGSRICCSIFGEHRKAETEGEIRGGVAQLGEHLPCKQGVMGSNPIISTNPTRPLRGNGLIAQ